MAETSASSVQTDSNLLGAPKRRLLNTYIVISLVGLGVFCGSGIRALSLIPEDAAPDKRNLWNQIFNKWAWLWTLVVLSPNALLQCFIQPRHRVQYLLLSFVRVVILGTSLWAFWTKFVIPRVKFATSDFKTEDGIKIPISGTGFDISGHTFLLMMSFLIIQEELSPLILSIFYKANKSLPFIHLRRRERRPPENNEEEERDTLALNDGNDTQCETGGEASHLDNLSDVVYYLYAFSFTGVIVFGILIQLLWIIMVFRTSLYFHTFFETTSGYAIAVAMWFLIYKIFQCLVMKVMKTRHQESYSAM